MNWQWSFEYFSNKKTAFEYRFICVQTLSFFVCVSRKFPFSFFLLPGRTFRFRFSKAVFSFFGLYKNAFDTYYKGKFEVVPRLYEETLVQVLSKSSDEEVAGYQIPQDVIEDYQDYIHCKSGRKAKEELRERYSSTYWYYSDYIH